MRFPQETIFELTTKQYINDTTARKMAGRAVLENQGVISRLSQTKNFDLGVEKEDVSVSRCQAMEAWSLGNAHRLQVGETCLLAEMNMYFIQWGRMVA